MNKTVELVNEWAHFEQKHPKNSIEDFCRYYLIEKREKEKRKLFDGNVTPPPSTDLVLLKLLGRIIKMYEVYINDAIKGVGIKKSEEFYFLNYIFQMKNPRKTEVIYANVSELSTGLAVLEQLKKSDFIKEKDDVEDKRSKRLTAAVINVPAFDAKCDRMFISGVIYDISAHRSRDNKTHLLTNEIWLYCKLPFFDFRDCQKAGKALDFCIGQIN